MEIRRMKALVLCAGEGTRMRPITYEIPKPMLPVKGKPVLEHILIFLKKNNVSEIYINISHLKEKIKDYFGKGDNLGIRISYLEELSLSGTAGPIKKLGKYFKETFVVTNGDELKDFDLLEMEKFHREKRALVTMALAEVEDPSLYGAVKLDDGKIIEFVEKPKKEDSPSNLINSGLYLMQPEVLSYLPKGYSTLEKELFPRLVKEGKIYGYKFDGQWFDTGSFERYEKAIKQWKTMAED